MYLRSDCEKFIVKWQFQFELESKCIDACHGQLKTEFIETGKTLNCNWLNGFVTLQYRVFICPIWLYTHRLPELRFL